MNKPDQTNWVTESHDDMNAKVTFILRAAGLTNPIEDRVAHYLIFSIYWTAVDGVREDLGDWVVRHPDFASVFAEGKVEFLLGHDQDDQPVYSKGYLNPTWADVLIEGERSCRARGAPELDHVFLEAVEPEGPRGADVQRFELIWGS